jgi:hypothetical protein
VAFVVVAMMLANLLASTRSRYEAAWAGPGGGSSTRPQPRRLIVSNDFGVLANAGVRALTTRVAAGLDHPAIGPSPADPLCARHARAREPRRLRSRVSACSAAKAGFTLIELRSSSFVLGVAGRARGASGSSVVVGQSKQAAARAQIELLGAGARSVPTRRRAANPNIRVQGLDALQRNSERSQLERPLSQEGRPQRSVGQCLQVSLSCRGKTASTTSGRRAATGRPAAKGNAPDIITSWDSSQK